MPTLEVTLGSNQILLAPRESWQVVHDHDPDWQQIRRKFLYFACEHRPVCYISYFPATVVQFLPNAQKVTIPKQRWYHCQTWVWMGYTEYCPKDVLDEILDSEEFQIGQLFFTSIDNASPERCRRFFAADQQNQTDWRSEYGEEMVCSGCDGRLITWISPPESLKVECESVLRAIAGKVGWGVMVSLL